MKSKHRGSFFVQTGCIMNYRKYIGDRAFYGRVFTVMIPILIQNVITNFVSLLDNLMVGQIGTEPMSGVAIVNQLIFIFNIAIFGGLAGPGIMIAQFYGKKDNDGVKYTFRYKLYVALAITVLFSTVVITLQDALIGMFLHEGDSGLSVDATMNYAKSYLAVMIWQVPIFAAQQVYAGTLRETGETMLPMKAGIIAVLVNLVGNWILIFGKLGAPALGVVGAAIATVISRITELLIIAVWTHKHKTSGFSVSGVYDSPYVPGPLVKKTALMSFPLFINEILWSTGMTTLNQCFSLRGLEVVSAVNITGTASNLFFCAFFAVGNTIAIMVGQLLGAGELERAKKEDTCLIAFSVTFATAVGIIMACVSPKIPELYNTIPVVKKTAAYMLIVNACMMPFNAFSHAAYFTLRSGGKTWITFVFDSGFVWAFQVPLAYILSHFTALPILPLYTIVTVAEGLKIILGYIFVKRGKWINNLVTDL